MKGKITLALALIFAMAMGNSQVAGAQGSGIGKTYYVNGTTGSNRNNGSKEAPIKDLQKAIDLAEEGSTILVAEGNYLGTLDQGFISIKKYVSIVGGYSSDFSECDHIKHVTSIRPTTDQDRTNGNHGYMDIYVRGKRNAKIVIDGIVFDMGQQTGYCAALPDNPVTGTPEGCETGRILLTDDKPSCPKVGSLTPQAHQLLHGDVEGNLIVRNCVFMNGYHYGIQMGNIGGNWEIYNNVFVSNRMAACEVRSMNQNPGQATLDFHNNTVLFSWCRTKHMEDMGYGLRFMTGIDVEAHNNIFGCSNLGALDRSYVDSNSQKEAARKTSAYDNFFFMNNADIILPSGGGKWLKVKAANFEDVEQLVKYENNKELAGDDKFLEAIDAAYLKGFSQIKSMSTSSFDPNSAANLYRQAHGLNMQGTETVRVSMFGNRYPYEQVFKLFGAKAGYGAQ